MRNILKPNYYQRAPRTDHVLYMVSMAVKYTRQEHLYVFPVLYWFSGSILLVFNKLINEILPIFTLIYY